VLLSWTITKALPYILSIFGGAFLFWVFSRLKNNFRIIRYFIWIIPFLIYFILNPIYQGDFSNVNRTINSKTLPINALKNELIVITIPGCPFCFGSIESLKILKKRNPSIKINFIVCSSDSSSILEYKKEIGKSFPINYSSTPEKWAKIAQGKFPSFLLVGKNQTKVWSNDGFGVRAKDEIESVISQTN
jgi:hypothetical protein